MGKNQNSHYFFLLSLYLKNILRERFKKSKLVAILKVGCIQKGKKGGIQMKITKIGLRWGPDLVDFYKVGREIKSNDDGFYKTFRKRDADGS